MKLQPLSLQELPPIPAQATADLTTSASADDGEDAPWYASVFLAIGAWVTSLIGIGAIVALVEFVSDDLAETTFLVLGVLLIAVGLGANQRARSLFYKQACVVAILAGQGLAVVASFILGDSLYLTALVSLSLSLVIIYRHPAQTLCFITSLASTGVLALAMDDADLPYWIDLLAIPCLIGGSFLILKPPKGRIWTGMAYALILAVPILGILLHLGAADSRHLNDLIISHDHAPFMAGWGAKLCLLALALVAFNRLQHAGPGTATPAALTALRVTPARVISAVLAMMIMIQPLGGAAATSLMVIAYLVASPALMTIMAVAQIIAVGQFYYELDISLLAKGGLLSVIGTLALTAWFTLRAHSIPLSQQPREKLAIKPIRLAATACAAALILGIAAQAVMSREAIIADGTRILLPLAPVDPRSLMQGDYMTLRLDPDVLPNRDHTPRIGLISLDIAQDGTVIGRSTTAPGGEATISLDRLPGASRQIRLAYHPQRGGFGRQGTLGYGIDSFFFQEGHAAAYEAAEYAVIMVNDQGQGVLVGLADERKMLIKPNP
ncbi:MAG: GDYXXLXY domain-containing protein [Pseudomonadota bacterium]